MTVGFVGLGLIGASLAMAVGARTACPTLGFDRDGGTQKKALSRGIVQGDLMGRLGECGLLILSVYPQAALRFVEEHAREIPRGCVVMDTCGVKSVVCAPMEAAARKYGFSFLGAHPMAGREFSGIDYAVETLFDGASMIFTPGEEFPGDRLAELKAFFLDLGFGQVVTTTPEDHDRRIAYTSQLAHVLSNAYVKSPAALGHLGFSAGSFRDLTRVAKLNETMWTELFLENREPLLEELNLLIRNLQRAADALEAGDAPGLRELLREGRERKELLERREREEKKP